MTDCSLCREKYGNTNGTYQEQEGPALVVEFLRDSGLPQTIVDRAEQQEYEAHLKEFSKPISRTGVEHDAKNPISH